MKVKDIKHLPDDTDIEVNSIWNDEKQELTPCDCEGHYDEEKKKFYITPSQISVAKKSILELEEYAGAVLNLIEDLLEENDITIPDEDREGDEGEARLYGGTYYELEEKIVDIMQDI